MPPLPPSAPTRRKRTSAPRQNNTRQILDAAEKVFAAHGLSGTRMNDIAEASNLPKANIHYYFRTKEDLYRATLRQLLDDWLGDASKWLSADRPPREGLRGFIESKMEFSRKRPEASRLFAHELLSGGHYVHGFLVDTLRKHVEQRIEVFRAWHEAGLITQVDPVHFLFCLWAMTQAYADVQVQMAAVLGKPHLTGRDYATGTQTIMQLASVLLATPPTAAQPGRDTK
ncbi:TetR/AcrR family transcriptional regulator [Komagataeibacter rhaeticus]|uniref:TetR/AcrR family transcriptional regulator n=1 Tax=Komagataeibacter rhaeticus TaxID=215221 RepID=UPI0004D83AF1|nr:TetR/AcrR family transcriptional regulator [Komagataeibacter rhaeticus]KDU97412.1 TetR family transcriptional regulator [Komagataeibacter rhaeticus AF1]MBL7238959.1 TetR family transcriptional regulator C-terminal domain-containing protein [Komagataeibacter rhaeticus]PYD54233.1 TetR/AcrR family transcriptional regulator [Komagataeibacter rhaeticus]GBQ15069.1 TetR family transcriptional regulator [Komagataeibacter rhaeticus DSM 16663]